MRSIIHALTISTLAEGVAIVAFLTAIGVWAAIGSGA